MLRKPHAILALFCFILMLAASCSARKGVTICLLPKKKGVPYFTSCAKGAEQAAKELGIRLIYDGPTDGSPEKQAAMIEQWTLQGVTVIAVSPNDPEVLAPALRKARRAGVKVLTWDADGPEDCRDFFVNQASSQEIGYAMVDALAKGIGPEKADVAVLTARLTAANQNAWIVAIKERIPTYPNLSLVTVKPSEEDQKLAFTVSKDLMKAYPNLKGIFAITSAAFPGAAEAVEQSEKKGMVQVTGLATPNGMREYVKRGTVKSVVLWNTVDLGYLTVWAADAVARGKLKEGATNLEAGRLGVKKVEGSQVLLGGILVFTKDNIDQYHF